MQGCSSQGWGLSGVDGQGYRAAGCLGTPQVSGVLPARGTLPLSPGSPSAAAQAGGPSGASLGDLRASPREAPSSAVPAAHVWTAAAAGP